MKWFDSFIGRPIVKILRIDSEEDYCYSDPRAVFIMFDKSNGLLLGANNDRNSIAINSFTFDQVVEEYANYDSEKVFNELKYSDELNYFIGQKIISIKVGEFLSSEIRSDSFIIKQGKYAGIIIESSKNK